MDDLLIDDMRVNAEVLYKQFRIPMPHVVRAQRELRLLRRVGRESVGDPQKILAIMGPSQSGKSTIVKDWRESITLEENLDGRVHPVLHLELTEKATVKSMGRDILKALGVSAPPDETLEEELRTRRRGRTRFDASFRDGAPAVMHVVVAALKNAKIEVLVLDEFHHLMQSDTAHKTMWSVTEAVKWLTNQGVCPIVCVGIKKMHTIIRAANNPQFANRQVPPIHLRPLDLADPEQAMLFGGYLEALDQLIVAHGILPERSGLSDDDTLECLYDVSKGVLGRVSRLVETATTFAIDAGHRRLENADLSQATDAYAIDLGLTDQNPWIMGARDVQVIRLLAANVE